MDKIAYVVSYRYGTLKIAQVIVERETEKSYILKSHGRFHESVYENIIGKIYKVQRIFPKRGQIYFSRKEAMAKGIDLLDGHIQMVRKQLLSYEKMLKQLTLELGAQPDTEPSKGGAQCCT